MLLVKVMSQYRKVLRSKYRPPFFCEWSKIAFGRKLLIKIIMILVKDIYLRHRKTNVIEICSPLFIPSPSENGQTILTFIKLYAKFWITRF
jgi:hypothetical protein